VTSNTVIVHFFHLSHLHVLSMVDVAQRDVGAPCSATAAQLPAPPESWFVCRREYAADAPPPI
jgi:hypothetical protein